MDLQSFCGCVWIICIGLSIIILTTTIITLIKNLIITVNKPTLREILFVLCFFFGLFVSLWWVTLLKQWLSCHQWSIRLTQWLKLVGCRLTPEPILLLLIRIRRIRRKIIWKQLELELAWVERLWLNFIERCFQLLEWWLVVLEGVVVDKLLLFIWLNFTNHIKILKVCQMSIVFTDSPNLLNVFHRLRVS